MNYTAPHLGEFVRDTLVKQGRTQRELADRLGISYASLTRSLNQPNFRLERIRQFSRFLKVDLFTLLLSDESRALLISAVDEKEAGKPKSPLRKELSDSHTQNERQQSELSALNKANQALEKEVATLKTELLKAKMEVEKEQAQVALLKELFNSK